ncbi:ABC transporter B family member 25 [Hordeum vulgare]|nr:ABC transporter B family member 25 [Hordeum vulgare]
MWRSGRNSGGGGDPECDRCIRVDDARKRAARRWKNQGLKLSLSLLHRETEEYDRRHGRTPSSVAGSSSAVGSSSAAGGPSGAALLPVKREWVDEPEDRELVAVKQEPEEFAHRGIVGPEDYVGDDVYAVAAAIFERSLREEVERRCHGEELEDLLFKQAVAANLAAKDKDDEWRRIREEQKEKFIDLVSFEEEDRAPPSRRPRPRARPFWYIDLGLAAARSSTLL